MLFKNRKPSRRATLVCTGLSLILAGALTGVQSCKPEAIQQPPAKAGDSAGFSDVSIVPTPASSANREFEAVTDPASVLTACEDMPEFNGDINSWLVENLRYPEAARKRGKQGRVVVKFIVTAAGSVASPQIIKSVDPELDAEALRAVSAMPAWKPGFNNGTAVPVYFHLPISFQLD